MLQICCILAESLGSGKICMRHLSIAYGIVKHLNQFSLPVFILHESLPFRVDAVLPDWPLELLPNSQIIAEEKSQVIPQESLHFVPVVIETTFLLVSRKRHEHIVSHFISLLKCQASRVKAFEN